MYSPGRDSRHARGSKRYRGSSRRLRQLGWKEHTPLNVWILLLVSLCGALIALACLATFS